MVLLACSCLNVKINTQENDLNFCDLTNNLASECVKEEFFNGVLAEVQVDSTGIVQEHKYLVHRRQVANWVLYKCLNCGLETHATQASGARVRVLVSRQLQDNPAVLERLMSSADFSPAFGIVLLNVDTSFTGIMPDPKSPSYESLQTNLNDIQHQLNAFLLQEEAAMEERIRCFEEEQRNEFTKLQVRVRGDKKKVISLLLASTQNQEMPSPEKDHQSVLPGFSQKAMESSFHGGVDSTTSKMGKEKKSLSRAISMPVGSLQQSLDPEDMFFLEGLEGDNEEPFYDSSADEEEDTESSQEISSPPVTVGKKRPLVYSSSVPICVPAWNTIRPNEETEAIEEQESTPSDPENIAASMQALAQSITDEGRYIFGDRPRPRLNTGDFNR